MIFFEHPLCASYWNEYQMMNRERNRFSSWIQLLLETHKQRHRDTVLHTQIHTNTDNHTHSETLSYTHSGSHIHSQPLRFRVAAAKIGDIRSLVLWIKNKQMMIYFRIRTECVFAGNVSIWYHVKGSGRMIGGYVGGGFTRLEIFSTKTLCEDQWRVVSLRCYSGPRSERRGPELRLI